MQLLQGEQERPAFALRCHLSGVQPAGDVSRWSRTAIEYLTDTLKDQNVFIVPKGERDEESFPVDLLLERRIEGDALNPETTEYPSVTDLLMERGVALPNRRLTRQKSGPQVTVPPKPVENPKPVETKDCTPDPLQEGSVEPSNCTQTQAVIPNGQEEASCDKTLVSKEPPLDKDCDLPEGETEESKHQQELENSDNATVAVVNGEAGPTNTEDVTIGETLQTSDLHATAKSDLADKTFGEKDDGHIQSSGDPPGLVQQPPQSVPPEAVTRGEGDRAVGFLPPVVTPCDRLTAVPTYVDWKLRIYVQEVREDEDMQGRFGYFLKEYTLETIIQDQHLASRGLHRARIPRDGNCLFRAFAQVIFNDQGYQGMVRKTVVDYLDKNWDSMQGCLGGQDKAVYLAEISRDRQYGGEPEIEAVCQSFNVSVELLMGGLDFPVQVRHYNEGDCEKMVRLVYVSDRNIDSGHYDLAMETAEDVGPVDSMYQTWRKTKMDEMRTWPMYQDNTLYDDSLLNQLMDHLHKHYAGSTPDPAATWTVGQPVIALFAEDQSFYRAKVTAISDKGIKVEYIDFGNSEIVPAEWLRKDIMLAEIPQQCLTCVLHGVRSKTQDGRWPKAVLDYVHKLVVNQQCVVEIAKRHDPTEDQEIRLLLPDGQDLSTLLVESGVALVGTDGDTAEPETLCFTPSPAGSSDGESEEEISPMEEKDGTALEMTVSTDIPERTVPSPYKAMTVPQLGDTLLISVTQINKPNEVYIQHVKVDESDSDQPENDAQRDLTAMLLLDSSMNAEAVFYEPLACLKTGAACCAQFSLDGRWYRGEILAVERQDETTVAGVLFVDYGSFEWISDRDRLRTLPGEFLSLPVQALRCVIGGLSPAGEAGQWSREAQDEATRIYLGQSPLIGLIQAVEPRVAIQLYSCSEFAKTHQLGNPVYQTLVDSGLACLNDITEDGTVIEEAQESCEDHALKQDPPDALGNLDDEVD